jgi:type I restriction enzyme M protein
MSTASIVSKVWSFCNSLRDVGVGYGNYLEQLTCLLFLKWPLNTASLHTIGNCCELFLENGGLAST